MKNKILFFILNLYLFVVGVSWLAFYFWLRIIRERHPADLSEIKLYYTSKSIIILGLIVLLHIYIVFYSMREIYYVYIKKSFYQPGKIALFFLPLIDKINNLVEWIYWKPIKYVHDFIMSRLSGSGDFLMEIAKFLFLNEHKIPFLLPAILFNYLPRSIISICLILDIFVFERMNYFFISLGLLLLPLLYRVFLAMLYDFADRNIPVAESIVHIEPKPNVKYSYIYTRTPAYEGLPEEIFQDYVETWEYLVNLKVYVGTFKFCRDEYISFVNLFCSLCYVICWSYYIFFMLS